MRLAQLARNYFKLLWNGKALIVARVETVSAWNFTLEFSFSLLFKPASQIETTETKKFSMKHNYGKFESIDFPIIVGGWLDSFYCLEIIIIW